MMSCSRDEYCNTIANNYSIRKDNIGNSLKNIKENISTVDEILNGFIIPNDYIGEKVKEKIKKITEELNINCEDVDLIKQDIDSFVTEKENEHREHYHTWKQKQELLKESGDDNG
jgi:hypothetical protein